MLMGVMEAVAGQHIPLLEEGLGMEECLDIPVVGLGGHSLQSWLLSLPICQGGLGLTSQQELILAAFIGTLEQALPFFGGVRGVCPPLAHLVGETGETRYQPLVEFNARTGRELVAVWQGMVQQEVREGMDFVGRQVEDGPFSVPVAGVGEGSTLGATRKILVRAREELRLEIMERGISLHPDQRGVGVSSWKERDKLFSAFLLSTASPK